MPEPSWVPGDGGRCRRHGGSRAAAWCDHRGAHRRSALPPLSAHAIMCSTKKLTRGAEGQHGKEPGHGSALRGEHAVGSCCGWRSAGATRSTVHSALSCEGNGHDGVFHSLRLQHVQRSSEEREGVLDAIRRLKLQHDSMDFFGARAEQPIETCLQEVRASDVLVVIVGHRYGSIVPERNFLFLSRVLGRFPTNKAVLSLHAGRERTDSAETHGTRPRRAEAAEEAERDVAVEAHGRRISRR